MPNPYGTSDYSGANSKKKKPPNNSGQTTHSVSLPSSIQSVLYSNKPSPPSVSSGVQQVIQSKTLIRKPPSPYSITESAWGASAYPKQSAAFSRVLPRLRSRLADEPAFNSILSQLMTDRYEAFEDRVQDRFSQQRSQYQTALNEALAAQDAELDFELPEMPTLPKIKRGQGVKSLLDTYTESIRPDMSDEVKDAYTNFYKYELSRLLDYKGDIRNQRSSLRGYRNNALTDANSQEARESYDQQAVGPKGISGTGNANAGGSFSSDEDGEGLFNSLRGIIAPASNLLDGSPIGDVLNKIGDESEDPVFWMLDKLSRPVYGVNNSAKAFYGLDQDENPSNWQDDAFGGLSGKSFFDSLDDIAGDPIGSTKELASEFWQGFSGKDKTLFGQVIDENANNDGVDNYRDSKWYQGPAGLVGDIALDPLSYVGLGIVTKPINASLKAREANRIANEASDLLKSGKEEVYSGVYDPTTKQHIPAQGPLEKPLNSKEIYDLMVGSGKVATSGAKAKNLAETNYRLQRLMYRIDNMKFDVDDAELVSMQDLGKAFHEQRAAVLKDFEGETVVEALRRDLEIKISQGKAPASDMDEFKDLLTSTYLEQKLIQANQYHKYLDDMAEKQFNVKASYEYDEVPNTGTRTVATPTNLMGRRENISVGVGGTTGKATKRKTSAWSNLEKQYENRKALYEKETDSAVKSARQQDLNQMRAKIDKILEEAPGGPLSELLPELVNDYRISPEQVDNLLGDAFRAAYDNPRFRKLTSESKGIYKQVRGGHNKQIRESAYTRWQFVNRQKNRILGDVAVKILKAHFAGSPAVKDVSRVAEIRAEIAKMDKEFGVPKISTEGDFAFDKWGDDTARIKRRQLQEELDSLKGYEQGGERQSLAVGIPDRVMTDGEFDLKKLKAYLRVDLRTGKAESNPFYGMFRVIPTLEKTDPETFSWLTSMRSVLQERYEPIFNELYEPVRAAKKQIRDQGLTPNKTDNIKWGQYTTKAAEQAEKQAFDSIARDIAFGRLDTIKYEDSVPLRFLNENTPEEQLIDALKWKYDKKTAALKLEKYTAQRTKADDTIKDIDQQLAGLRTKYAEELARQNQIVAESKEAARIMSRRLREESLLTAAQLSVSPMSKQLTIRAVGQELVIPHSQALFKGVEAMSGLPLIKQTRQAFANAFASPASRLPEEMQLARARALGQTPIIIEHHVNKLRATLGQTPEHQRVRAWDSLLKGHGAIVGEQPVQDAIRQSFDDLLPYFKGYEMGPAGRLSVADINRYLPEEFRLNINYVNKNGIDTVQDLVNAIRSNKVVNKADRSQLKDPYRVSWALRVGVEQAQARKALEHTVNSTFGVRDLKTIGAPGTSELMGEFQKLGWQRIPQLGNDHIFPPEIIPDVNRLLDMLEPRNISNVGRLFDRVTGYWKTMTTIYNPGYWTRNGIGEVMSAWLGGVNDPRYYHSAFNGVIKYARGDGMELDAIKKQFSMLNHVQSDSVPGAKKVASLSDGSPITAEQAWVAYNDQGLKTGFINTEFDAQYSRLGDIMRSNPGTQSVANMHNKLRNAGEWYEDGLRMAHFLHAMEKSGAKTLEGAAEYAAKEVRKYHFDYTDFTNLEKTVMLRAFPFYKWTRKALPLMATSLFTKPGKMLAYPKAMNTVQNTITTQDIAADDNGFAPNYGELVPGWMQDLWSYQIAGNEEMGSDATYFNLATPQMDSLKAMGNPGSTAYGLLNPLFKFPAEAAQIASGNGDQESFLKSLAVKGDFGAEPSEEFDLQTRKQGISEGILSQLLRTTPQGNFVNKTGVTDGVPGTELPNDGSIESFLTGLGIYVNDDDRRKGVLMNRE